MRVGWLRVRKREHVQAAKALIFGGLYVRAEARTYFRFKGKSKDKLLRTRAKRVQRRVAGFSTALRSGRNDSFIGKSK